MTVITIIYLLYLWHHKQPSIANSFSTTFKRPVPTNTNVTPVWHRRKQPQAEHLLLLGRQYRKQSKRRLSESVCAERRRQAIDDKLEDLFGI